MAPVANAAYDTLYEPTILKRIKFEPFYFRLGQEIRVEVDKLPEDIFADQKLSIKRAYLRARQRAKKYGNNAHETLRLVVTGVSYPNEQNKSDPIREELQGTNNDQFRYYLFEPNKTILQFDQKPIRRWNTLKQLDLEPSIVRIFDRFPAYRAIEELVRLKLQENPANRNASVLLIHTKAEFMLDEYFQYLAARSFLNYLPVDCAMEHSLQPIAQFVRELYKKTPCFCHVRNLDWVH